MLNRTTVPDNTQQASRPCARLLQRFEELYVQAMEYDPPVGFCSMVTQEVGDVLEYEPIAMHTPAHARTDR